MRKLIKIFVKICSENLPIDDPIYEFGSYQVSGQINLANLRKFFPNKKYIGADMRKGPGVDVILNLHEIKLPAASVGTVLLLDTIEHVEFPRKAFNEIYRILKPDGILIVSSHMNYAIHNHPFDYWRFTPEAFRSLLKQFNFSIVESVGIKKFPHTIVGIGFKGSISKNYLRILNRELKLWKNSQYFKYKMLLREFLPPILFRVYHKLF